jgi:hypothetical protein
MMSREPFGSFGMFWMKEIKIRLEDLKDLLDETNLREK